MLKALFEPISQLTKKQKLVRYAVFYTILADIILRTMDVEKTPLNYIIETAFLLCLIGLCLEWLLKRGEK